MNRRRFLAGLIAAPAIVRCSSLMALAPVRPLAALSCEGLDLTAGFDITVINLLMTGWNKYKMQPTFAILGQEIVEQCHARRSRL